MGKRGFTLAELLAVIVIIVVLALVLLPARVGEDSPHRRASCQNNLMQLGIICKMFENESPRGVWPRIQGDAPWLKGTPVQAPGCTGAALEFTFAMKSDQIYAEYLTDPTVLKCPSDEGVKSQQDVLQQAQDDGSGTCQWVGFISRGDYSYFYLGYCLDRVKDSDNSPSAALMLDGAPFPVAGQVMRVVRYLEPFIGDNNAANEDVLGEDIKVEAPFGNNGGDVVHRLRNNIERFLISDINNPAAYESARSHVPVMWDNITATLEALSHCIHQPPGVNVLYMDGHVGFAPYPKRFPADESWPRVQSWLDALREREEVRRSGSETGKQ